MPIRKAGTAEIQTALDLSGGSNHSAESTPVYIAPEIGSFKLQGRVALDIETHDPDIGASIGTFDPNAYILGVALGHAEQGNEYFAVRSGFGGDQLADEEAFKRWLKAEAMEFEGEIVGANLQYDLSMLRSKWGIVFPKAKFLDVQVAEPLLDENQYSYSLANILKRHGLDGKESALLDDIGGIANLAQAPAHLVAKYAKRDVSAPLELIERQLKMLEEEQLLGVWETESRLIPILVDMHIRGVPVNIDKAQDVYAQFGKEIQAIRSRYNDFDPWASASVATLFDDTPKTATGKPSITKAWLKARAKAGDKEAEAVLNVRELDKTRSTFLESYIMNRAIKHGDEWRIHCQFHQLKSEEGGTVSGRFSSSSPNLQNIPSRHPVLGPLMRSMFIPEHGCRWGCADWSQIEYRKLVHFAVMIPGIDQSAFEAQARYQNDPKTDFHEVAAEITGVPRKDAKGINFGVVYGMGKDSMAANLGKDLEEAEAVLKLFHGKFPFVKQTYNFVKDRADMRGFIRTISGRKRRFPLFQGKNWKTGEEYTGSEDEVAEWAQGQRGKGRVHIGREGTHAALNSLLQGSSADLMKEAMVKMDQDGVFDVLRCHLTVHDELDSSFPDDAAGRQAFEESVRIMETVRKLNVPATASANDGMDWNEAK